MGALSLVRAAFATTAILVLPGMEAMAVDGLVTAKSAFGPAETISRLETEVKGRGMTVFAKIDHAAGAAAVGLPLRPTTLLIFGAAKGGTPLMQAVQTMGIDLPLKALVWQSEGGETYLSYNDPAYLARRHGADASAENSVHAMSEALKAIVVKVTTAP